MPELPEVETIRRDAEQTLLGRRVTVVSLHVPEVVRYPTPEALVAGLTGRQIVSAERRAKYLLLRLDDCRFWVLHFSLEGRFLYEQEDAHLGQGTLLVATLDNGHLLVLRDHISYTKTYLLAPEDLGSVLKLHAYGPEPVMPGFTEALMRACFAGRRAMIKPLLLDQHNLSGVGNIYADEALFRACIHPERKAHTLTDGEWRLLHRGLVDVLNEGIADRGTTAPGGLYRDLFGQKGHHQEHLAVFRRDGEHCPRCQAAIRHLTVSGRPTFICPNCQQI